LSNIQLVLKAHNPLNAAVLEVYHAAAVKRR